MIIRLVFDDDDDDEVRLNDDEGEANNCFITPLAFRGVVGGGWFSELELVVCWVGESTKRRRRPSLKIKINGYF